MLLTRQDSNLYRKIQSLPCCRYTTSYYSRFNRIRTHTTRVETLHAIHYTINLVVLYKGIEPLSSDRKSDALNHYANRAFCGSYENRTRISRETVGKDSHYPNEPILYIYQESNLDLEGRKLLCFPLHHRYVLHTHKDSNLNLKFWRLKCYQLHHRCLVEVVGLEPTCSEETRF